MLSLRCRSEAGNLDTWCLSCDWCVAGNESLRATSSAHRCALPRGAIVDAIREADLVLSRQVSGPSEHVADPTQNLCRFVGHPAHDRMAHQQTANRQRPQNSLGALDCEARIARARSGFQRIRIAIRLTSTTYCHAQRVGGR